MAPDSTPSLHSVPCFHKFLCFLCIWSDTHLAKTWEICFNKLTRYHHGHISRPVWQNVSPCMNSCATKLHCSWYLIFVKTSKLQICLTGLARVWPWGYLMCLVGGGMAPAQPPSPHPFPFCKFALIGQDLGKLFSMYTQVPWYHHVTKFSEKTYPIGIISLSRNALAHCKRAITMRGAEEGWHSESLPSPPPPKKYINTNTVLSLIDLRKQIQIAKLINYFIICRSMKCINYETINRLCCVPSLFYKFRNIFDFG